MRILVIDDEESTRLLLARTVSQGLDAEVQLAGTCEQALRFAEAGPYDAILLDLLMPGIGGLAVLYRVRRSGPNAATPVIVVSAVKDEETIERCMSAGAHDYLTKPVRPTELARTLRKHLGS
jgi:CheY-like chemotaxis protein